ncbi:hypothetical protein AN936_18485 [Sphingopyxis macrogoltabida]|uniref:Uncharacterized protein n=1 Tax=Sphingopyxis macrogoltabida TaxID=33050 RepID=A0A0N9UFN2_SPHMC|nr:hypothetical protein AN936_18485 [Sphingopyxis macrogoltabida]
MMGETSAGAGLPRDRFEEQPRPRRPQTSVMQTGDRRWRAGAPRLRGARFDQPLLKEPGQIMRARCAFGKGRKARRSRPFKEKVAACREDQRAIGTPFVG